MPKQHLAYDALDEATWARVADVVKIPGGDLVVYLEYCNLYLAHEGEILATERSQAWHSVYRWASICSPEPAAWFQVVDFTKFYLMQSRTLKPYVCLKRSGHFKCNV